MADYKNDGTELHPAKSRRSGGGMIALLLIIVALVIGLLFATGFWSADVKSGALPEVSVNGGALPKVDLQSKEIVVGTTTTKVEVPTVKTETTTVEVPTIGVKSDKK